MLTSYTQGLAAETKVTKFLLANNYYIVSRRYKTKYGELDIVAIDKNDDNTVCIIEVKYRSRGMINFQEQAEYGLGTKQKARIIDAAQIWLMENSDFLKFFYELSKDDAVVDGDVSGKDAGTKEMRKVKRLEENGEDLIFTPVVRFDVVCLSSNALNYYKNAFSADE